MSFSLRDPIWQAPIDGTLKLVLLRLSCHADREGASIYPSIPSVAKACGMSIRTVQGAIKQLKSAGILIEVSPASPADRHPAEYRIDQGALTCSTLVQKLHQPSRKICTSPGAENDVTLVQNLRTPGAESADEPFIEPIREPSINPARVVSGRYAFAGKVIRLSQKDHADWKQRYHGIPDLDLKLESLDRWYSENLPAGEQKSWWNRAQNALEKAHQQLLGEQQRSQAHAVKPGILAETEALYRAWGVQ